MCNMHMLCLIRRTLPNAYLQRLYDSCNVTHRSPLCLLQKRLDVDLAFHLNVQLSTLPGGTNTY